MDERLEAGRHHLKNGDRALQLGYPDDARAHFESAVLQFRGPELRLGEAHALRGLAQVDLATGETSGAERRVREAINTYQQLHALLDLIDAEGLSEELRRDAREGEAAAMVVLGDVLVRQGRNDEAREALGYARQIHGGLDHAPSAAGVWTGVGRLAIREGRYHEADEALDRAMDIHRHSGDLVGQVAVSLLRAELRRLQQDLGGAEGVLEDARPLAHKAGNPMFEGRVLAALGALMLQSLRLDEARTHYGEALPLVRDAGDLEMEAYALLGLGDVESRTGAPEAVGHLIEGARILTGLRHVNGVAGALLRIGEHGLRIGQPDLALVAAEGARRQWSSADPVRGVGLALRVVVKALAALHEWKAVLTTAMARAALAGSIQPNALAVADFYMARAPQELVAELKALTGAELLARVQAKVEQLLARTLDPVEVPSSALDTLSGAYSAVEILVERLPRPESVDEWSDGAEAAADVLDASTGPEDAGLATDEESSAADELLDADDLTLDAPEQVPGADDEAPDEAVDALGQEAPDDAADASDVDPEPVASEAEAAPGYEGLYEVPEADTDDEPDGDEPEEPDDPDLELPDELGKAPPPEGYADFYELPAESDEE